MVQHTSRKKSAVVLLSGGLDSSVATLWAIRSWTIRKAITIDYGQPSCSREIRASKRLCKKLKINHEIIKLPWYKKLSNPFQSKTLPSPNQKDLDGKKAFKSAKAVWLPERNLLFLSIASAYAEKLGCDGIIAGLNAEEGATFPDNSVKFIKNMQNVLKESSFKRLKLVIPTAKWDKTRILKEGNKLGLLADHIWSCYRNGKKMCGKCESCKRLLRAANTTHNLNFLRNKMYGI